MSALFNHGRRHGFVDRNPISLVRQSAKRQTAPDVLLPSEINRLLQGLRHRERTLVVLAAGTGLRMCELFGLKWRDIDFAGKEASVLRSIVKQAVGPCKTEASQKPVPPRPPSGSDSSCMASLCALPSANGLGLRQFGDSG